jgi:PAS domain S-box-containing protein
VRVLLVDDNRDDRALVLRGLAGQQPDLEAIEVTDADGLTVALARPPDVVITDYQLHFSDGLTVLRQVKDIWPDAPVIMYTGTGSEEVAVEAMKAGLDDYVLKKPGEMPRLLAAVRRLLQSARHRKAAEEAEGRYRKLFDGVPIGLFRAAPDGSLLDCNMALVRMLGYPDRDALLARKTTDTYVDAADRPALMERLMREGSIRDYEARRLRHDGAPIWARTSVQAVKARRGPHGAQAGRGGAAGGRGTPPPGRQARGGGTAGRGRGP